MELDLLFFLDDGLYLLPGWTSMMPIILGFPSSSWLDDCPTWLHKVQYQQHQDTNYGFHNACRWGYRCGLLTSNFVTLDTLVLIDHLPSGMLVKFGWKLNSPNDRTTCSPIFLPSVLNFGKCCFKIGSLWYNNQLWLKRNHLSRNCIEMNFKSIVLSIELPHSPSDRSCSCCTHHDL